MEFHGKKARGKIASREGGTGSEDTEYGIIPPLVHDIGCGRGAIIIDMKGDSSLRDKIMAAMVAAKREDDFLSFSLAEPNPSHFYNPFRALFPALEDQ